MVKVQCEYPNGYGPYTFLCEDDTVRVGDILDDCGQDITVVAIGSDYDGPTRTLTRIVERAKV